MSFKVINTVTDDVTPVKETSNVSTYMCKDFKGELSSKTGIYSKFMYIGKINQLSGKPENPTIRIICGAECINECINLKKRNNDKNTSESNS